MCICGRLVLIALCLSSTCATRVLAQGLSAPASNIGRSQVELYDASEPALSANSFPNDAAVVSDECADVEAGSCPTDSAPQLPPFNGCWHCRPKLTGDWCCLREHLRDCGYTLDIRATEYYQGVATGGLQEAFEFGGRNDYLLNVDGQKAGLWEGLYINLHGETVYGESVNLLTGAVVPVNIGRSLPVVDGTLTALTAVKFTQALSENFLVYGGKINTIDNLRQPFVRAPGLDTGFMNGAFNFNPVLGRTIPYSTLGAGAAILAGGQPVVTLTVYDTNDASTHSV